MDTEQASRHEQKAGGQRGSCCYNSGEGMLVSQARLVAMEMGLWMEFTAVLTGLAVGCKVGTERNTGCER